MPVSGSTVRDSVSVAMTCVDLSFHGQYFRQFAVETSSHEYSNVHFDSKTFIVVSVCRVWVACKRYSLRDKRLSDVEEEIREE
jgi:hypothetical protein